MVQPDGERGPAQTLTHAGRRPSGSGPGVRPGAGGLLAQGASGAAAEPQGLCPQAGLVDPPGPARHLNLALYDVIYDIISS